LPSRQGSSVVEQGTHKPLVGSSTLPPGSFAENGVGLHSSRLRWSSLHWIVRRLDARFAQHLRGHTATTKRLGEKPEIAAKKEVPRLEDARRIERALKRKKNPALAVHHLER
jgi:hypothetical protein